MNNILHNQKSKDTIAYILPVIMIISHILAMISLYPGIYHYDVGTQIDQYTSGVFNTNHPIIHTLFVGFFSQLTGNNTGYAIATIIQIIVVDLAIYYMLMFVYRKTKRLLLHLFFVCFFSFTPFCAFLIISHTKDILFAAFGIVFVIDILRYREKGKLYTGLKLYLFEARFVVNIILMILFRNNASYAYIVMLILLLVVYIKSKRLIDEKRFLAILLVGLILSLTTGKILTHVTGANSGSIKEMMSLPCQVVARIYNTTASESEKETIKKYIPEPETYQYYLSDPIKKQLNFDTVDSECKHFLLDSSIIALHHPIQSFLAVWYNIQGYFDPLHCPYSSDHFYLVSLEYRGGAVLTPRWWSLFDWYHTWFYTSENLAATPLVIFFNMALYIWIYIISLIVVIRRKGIQEGLSYLFPLLYLGTLLLGPGAIIRYGFIYILLLPVAIMNLLKSTKN